VGDAPELDPVMLPVPGRDDLPGRQAEKRDRAIIGQAAVDPGT
jgi:hypothetical protein